MANITISENFDNVLAFLSENGADQTLIDFIADRKSKAQKKSNSKHKVTDSQSWLRNEIIRILTESEKPLAVGEIMLKLNMEGAPEGAKTSTSAITANIGTMLINGKNPNPEGVIVRELEGKTAKFSMADTDTEGAE